MSTMLGQYLCQFGQKLVRRKPQFREEPESSETHPPNTLDLVVIGLDNMLGAGIYILVGGVAKYVAGPAIILFLLVAGLTTVLSGLHFSDGEAEATGVSCLTCPLTTDQSSGDQSAPPRTQLNPEPAD